MKNSTQQQSPQTGRRVTEFSEWLEREMRERGLTLQQVADVTGVVPNTIRSWRNGWTTPPYDKTARIAEAMSADVAIVRGLAGYGEVIDDDDPEATELASILAELQAPARDSLLVVARALRDSQRRRGRSAQSAARGREPRLRLSAQE